MQPLQPEQASFLLHTIHFPALKNEHRITKNLLAAIPLDKGDYRPDPISKTAMELAWHIVAAEKRFLSGVAVGVFDFTPIHKPESVKNSADLAAWYADDFAKNLQGLEHLTGEQLNKTIDFRGMFQFPAVAYLQFSLNHTIHHRGQLSTYLRPMGAKVPSIYGESYDDAEARKAAQA